MSNPAETRLLRVFSRSAGGALLAACCVLPLLLYPLLDEQGPAALSEFAWENLLSIIAGLLILLPAALLGWFLLPARQRRHALPFGKPKGRPFALVFAGTALCYWANWATAFVVNLGARAGVEFHGPQEPVPRSVSALLLSLLAVAIVPAVTEELLFRGVMMQPLRLFGEGFAVVCSAVLFALLHRNMQQAPMAFVSGLALGWAAVRGGSLWVPILIHFWNNAASVLLQFFQGIFGEAAYGRIAVGYVVGLTSLGLLGALVSFMDRDRQRMKLIQAIPPLPRALRYLFGSVPMLLAIGWCLWEIWHMTSFG